VLYFFAKMSQPDRQAGNFAQDKLLTAPRDMAQREDVRDHLPRSGVEFRLLAH
jgi:hypothetical protein